MYKLYLVCFLHFCWQMIMRGTHIAPTNITNKPVLSHSHYHLFINYLCRLIGQRSKWQTKRAILLTFNNRISPYSFIWIYLNNNNNKVIIIGSGPAGLTAAIYAARGGLEPVVISGNDPGGQLMLTTDVENFPGFPDAIGGPELMQNMRKQAERFGTKFIDAAVGSVDFLSRPFKFNVGDTVHTAEAVIIATGSSA